MGMGLSGLASGFDWKSMVDQLIEVSRAPQNRMRSEQSKNSSKTSAINEIKGLLANLKTDIASLGSQDALLKRSASLGGTATGWSASASTTASAGKYTFSVTTLATAAKWTGAGDLAGGIDPDLPLSGQPLGRTIVGGNFTVNGTIVTIDSGESLNAVLTKVKAASGVTDATFDPGTGKVTITSASPVVLGASNDTSNFLLAMRLSSGANPTSSASLGSLSFSGPIASANLKTQPTLPSSTFLINGTSISYNTATDSLQDLITRINESAAGVTASMDAASGSFVLTNDTTGNVGIFVSEDTGGMAASLGLTDGSLTNGNDASFNVNGGLVPLTSRTNTLDATSHGITGLSVTATSTGTDIVTVASDSTATKSAVDSFIAKYNAVQSAIDKYTKVTVVGTKVTAGILSSNRELGEISKSLRQMIYKEGTGVSGSIKRLSDLGVGFSGIENTISVTNSSLLTSKLADFASDVSSYFNTKNSVGGIPSGGLIERMDYLLGNLVTESGTAKGSLKTNLDTIVTQNKSLDAQITALEKRLESQRSTMEASFIAMEKSQSIYQQQSAYINKTFAGKSN